MSLVSMFFIFLFVACTDDPQLPDNLANFESDQLGFAADENELAININFSRPADQSGSVVISVEMTGVEYNTDFTTSPASSSNSLTIDVPKGASQASFVITRLSNALLDGDESISFSIISVPDKLLPGSKPQLVLSFAEILAQQAIMDINGGGSNYPNKVFIDLSANRQTAVNRTNWDLGFYGGADFRVTLNSSVTMMARELDKTDLNSVTAADTIGFNDAMIIGANASAAGMAWIDDPAGDLTKTAIASISATDSENKVYIINRGAANPPNDPSEPVPTRGWKKVRFLRNTSGYTVQYADISATSFQEFQVSKDEQLLFKYISFDTGSALIEPQKNRWDIAWTGFTNATNLGGGFIPYFFQDVVLQNRNGVETVELLTANVGSYENFDESDLAGLVFSTHQLGIGTKWRSGGGPGSAPAIRSDRFYVVKDADGNIYKLRFTALTQDGQRGRPQVEFELIK